MFEPTEKTHGVVPLRNSDDQPANYEVRAYVATGASRTSLDDELPDVSPPRGAIPPPRGRLTGDELPPPTMLPEVRTAGELPPRTMLPEVRTAGELPPRTMLPDVPTAGEMTTAAPARPPVAKESLAGGADARELVLRACQLLEAEDREFSGIDIAMLRAAATLFDELGRLAREKAGEAPAATPSGRTRQATTRKAAKRQRKGK